MAVRTELIERGPWLSVGRTRRAEWVRVVVSLPHGPAPALRFLHLSDLHTVGRPHPVLDHIAARLTVQDFHAVLVTGDLVDDRFDSRRDLPGVAGAVARLRSRWGTFAILGNHDGDLVGAWLGSLGVVLVSDRHVRLGEGGETVDLVGLPGVVREASSVFYDRERDAAVPTVAMSHYPDAIHRLGRLRPDVMLAGHTHGGQISLPGRVPIIKHDSLPRHMCQGVHETENGVLVVSRGIGHTVLPIRLFAPPQVIELVLEREA